MLTDREIISTLEMLQNEHLDVRTVTLGVNLLDCAANDLRTLKDNIMKRITTLAKNLVRVCDQVGDKYGIPVVNKRIAVSPIAVVGAPCSTSQFIEIAKLLDRAAEEVDVAKRLKSLVLVAIATILDLPALARQTHQALAQRETHSLDAIGCC